MAEFHFFSLKSEWQRLLEAVVYEHGLRFVHDAWYPAADAPMQSEVTEHDMAVLINGKRSVFLFGNFSKKGPFLRRQNEGEMAGQHFVDITRGGPCLDFTLPVCYEDGNILRLGNGTLHVRANYQDDFSQHWYDTPEETKSAYDSIVKTLKKQLTRVQLPESIWLTDGAIAAITNDQALLNAYGTWRGKDHLNIFK